MMKRKSPGVTLVELCCAMAILAIVAAMAAPSFRSSLRAAAVRTATYELFTAVQQVRANAIVESTPDMLCPSDAAGNCLPATASAAFWSASRDVHALPDDIVLRTTRSPLRFWPDALSASTGTLTICDVRGVASPRSIVVSQTGRARLAAVSAIACR
jgi:prepilin-type N-terminal cleavage/methylation domain-containing protein